MAIVVSDQVMRATTQCDKNSACLQGDGKPICTVEHFFGKDLLFVKCPNGLRCPYKKAFGFGHRCTCPTRLELYKKHGI